MGNETPLPDVAFLDTVKPVTAQRIREELEMTGLSGVINIIND